MKAIITVIGKDTVGILAKVSAACAADNANIVGLHRAFFRICLQWLCLLNSMKRKLILKS